MLVPLAEHVECVPQNLVALEFRLRPFRRNLFDLKRLAILQIRAKTIHRLAENPVGLALLRFKRANLINQIVHHVAHVHRVQHAEPEIDRKLQAGLARLRLDAVAVLEEQHAEPIESRIFQREAILRLIHAKAARSARSRREKHVVIEDLLPRNPFFFKEL